MEVLCSLAKKWCRDLNRDHDDKMNQSSVPKQECAGMLACKTLGAVIKLHITESLSVKIFS